MRRLLTVINGSLCDDQPWAFDACNRGENRALTPWRQGRSQRAPAQGRQPPTATARQRPPGTGDRIGRHFSCHFDPRTSKKSHSPVGLSYLMAQGKIERWHQTLKNRILWGTASCAVISKPDRRLGRRLERPPLAREHRQFTPSDVYLGRGPTNLIERERVKQLTSAVCRSQHRPHAARQPNSVSPNVPYLTPTPDNFRSPSGVWQHHRARLVYA
jgi:putative transposase